MTARGSCRQPAASAPPSRSAAPRALPGLRREVRNRLSTPARTLGAPLEEVPPAGAFHSYSHPGKSGTGMQRFELSEGSSSKFWEVEVMDKDLTVRFGRIGSAGQTRTKSFDSHAAAVKERDRLVKEKTGKGYACLATAGEVPLAPTSPSPSPDAATESVPVAASSATPPPAGQADAAILWPTGGFQWNDTWRAQLPVVRGIHAPPLDLSHASVSDIPDIEDASTQFFDEFDAAAAASGRGWTLWQQADGQRRLTPQAVSKPDFEYWLELHAQVNQVFSRHRLADWLTQVGLKLHGIAFMLEVMLEFVDIAQGRGACVMYRGLPTLRQAIACADGEAHDQALAVAARLRGRNPALATWCAHLFPHRQDWALEALQAAPRADQGLLTECAMPVAAMLPHLRRTVPYFDKMVPACLLQVSLHGEAALPVLTHLLRCATRDKVATALRMLMDMQVPALIPALIENRHIKEVRAALDQLAQAYPAAVLRSAIDVSSAARSRSLEGWALRLALRHPVALTSALATLSEAERRRFRSLLAAPDHGEAPPDRLPELLRHPPWLRKARVHELPTLDLPPLPTPTRVGWTDEQAAAYRAHRPDKRIAQQIKDRPDKAGYSLAKLCIVPAAHARVLAGEWLRPGDVQPGSGFHGGNIDHLPLMAAPTALAIWNSYPARHWQTAWNDFHQVVRYLLAQHGEAAVPGLVNLVEARPGEGLALALPVDSPALVPSILHALHKLKKLRSVAIAWIEAHPRTMLMAALPLAFGTITAGRDEARSGLRWMLAHGFEAEARAVASEYGCAMADALQALLDADPLLELPPRMPGLPSFFVPTSFRRPELRDGGVLPPTTVEHLGSMLAISTLEAPYAGLQVVRELCTPASLAEFAWDLFEAWNADGRGSRCNWAFTALGLLGDDETARRLATKIREWPGEGAHQRAVAGLDLLAAIGSDVALMHLNGIAGKVKFKALQDKAREKIAAVAEARGFTTEELADRLVPDLGLDEQGTLRLDFGPRRFVVAFDETLKPFVRDGQGTRLKDLPKPLKSDDAALAGAATERYKQIKKDAKAVGSLQIIRLEMGMVARRRWSAADFRLFFLEHPLMRHLAARVVWGVYVDGCMTQGFRVAEDLSLADGNDELFVLPEAASVGLAHVLEMPAALQAAFGQVFANYEILQPFKQLGRETFGLTEAEKAGHEITRFKDKAVAIGSVMGLGNRGWERGAAEDGGWVHQFHKPLPGGLQADLELDPGTMVGDLSYEPKQKLPSISLRKSGSWDRNGLVTFAALDPILASELLRDIELLAPLDEGP